MLHITPARFAYHRTFRLLLLGLLAGTQAYAGGKMVAPASVPVATVGSSHNGWYIGGGAGAFSLKNHPLDESFSSMTGTLMVGYEINDYLAVEARWVSGPKHITFKEGTLHVGDKTLKSRFSNRALYARIGYPMDDVKPYILVGYGQSKITSLHGNDRLESSWQYGAGLSYKASESLELFGDYVRAYHGKGFDGRSMQEDITVGMATVGIAYHF